MTGIELFIWILLAIGWILFQVVRRILKPPRPLGKIEDEAPAEVPPSGQPWPPQPSVPAPRRAPAAAREAPLDVEWGRTPEPPPPLRPPPAPRVTPPPRVPARVADEPFAWSADRAGSELALAREMGRRQAERRRAVVQAAPRRHPYRPRLQTHADMRKAIVVAAVLGPCRAFDPYRSPEQQP
jgi:hypothetical protein